MSRSFYLAGVLLFLSACAAQPNLTATTCDELERELDIAIADMSKPVRDRHYARSPTGLAGAGTIGAIAVNAAGTLGVDRLYDVRIDAPEAYAKSIGRQLAIRCQ